MLLKSVPERFNTLYTKNPLPFQVSGFILFVHFILATYGIDVININGYQQLMHEPEASQHFWQYVWYMHGNPPGLSLIFGLCKFLTSDPYRALTVILPLLHVGSLIAFYYACENFKLKLPKLFFYLIFLNPLLFLYFKYPFYCTFIFFNSCCLIYFLSKLRTLNFAGLAALISIICFNSVMRSTWHIAFVIILICGILVKTRVPGRWWLTLAALIPLSFYAKNYYLYGAFTSSSWFGASLAGTHIGWGQAKPGTIAFDRVPHGTVADYKGRYDSTDSRIAKYAHVPELNHGDWQDIRYLVISGQFLTALKESYNWRWSANAVLAGAFLAMKSPAGYFLLEKQYGGITLINRPIFNYDWFCPIDFKYRNPYFFSFIDMPEMYRPYKPWDWLSFVTPYTVVWYGILLFFTFYFFKLPFVLRVFYLITCISLGIFILVDNAESQRMRFEVEPYLYLFAGVILSRWRNGTWAWMKADNSSVIKTL